MKEQEPPKETERECSELGKVQEGHVTGSWQVMGIELFRKKKAMPFSSKCKSDIK